MSETGLREAAQALLRDVDIVWIWLANEPRRELGDSREALRAALAAAPDSAGLNEQRLVDALNQVAMKNDESWDKVPIRTLAQGIVEEYLSPRVAAYHRARLARTTEEP